MSKKLKCNVAVAVSVLVCILLFAVRVTGVLFHMLAGIFVVIAIVVHVVHKSSRFKYIPVKWRVTDIVLTIAALFLMITGMLIHPMKDMAAVLMVHKLSAVVLVIACVVHVVSHRQKQSKASSIEKNTRK